MTYGGSTYGGAAVGSTSGPTPDRDRSAVFQVTRDGDVIEDAVFDVDPLVDTANPFGDYAVVKMDDTAGAKFEQYPRGTRIDVEVSEGYDEPFVGQFTGYVVERRETEQSGADVLEVEAYSFDQFIRRNTVTNDQSGNTISEAFADIIQTDTPVNYNAAKVNVGDDQELTRSYQGEPVENALRDFAFKSNNEEFGVDDDLDAFFRPRETEHIDRGIDNTQWFNYDIPELGKEAINEVEVWFDDGEESVIVDDGTDKLDLQDNLGLPDPGTQRAELQRPLITDINDAEDIGRKYLTFRNSTLSGTVTTFGLFEAEPGDTIDITIEPRGIDDEFVIASTEYRWGVDQTILTIVEKRGDVDDILSELNDSVQRQEMQGANRDAPKNRITTTNATALISITADADGNTPDADRFVNDGRRAVRDAWTGEDPPDITTLVVGDGGGGLSRSNTSLVNQTNSAALTQSLPDSTSVTFEASITQDGVGEIGIETAGGTLIARAIFDTAVDLDGTVTVTLDVSNDASVSRGVLTNAGQTAVRDVLADTSPAIPTDYGYGSDGGAVGESDTSLGNEVVSVSLDDIFIQGASTNSGFESITNLPETSAIGIQNDRLELLQSCFTVEGEAFSTSEGDAALSAPNSSYSGGNAQEIFGSSGRVEYEFTTDYTIPGGDFAVRFRSDAGGTSPIQLDVSIDGTTLIAGYETSDTIEWEFIARTSAENQLDAGTHTLVFEGTTTGTDSVFIDVVAPYDERFTYTFDNTLDGSSGYLDGPEWYPDADQESFATATTRRDVTTANFDLSANDVSNGFYVELANDGATFTRVNNSQTGVVNFASPDTGVDTNIQLSRFGSTAGQTPKTGVNGQQISAWELRANPDAVLTDNIGQTNARAVVPPGTITGQTIREAGLKNGSTLLTHHQLAEFDVLADQRLASSETTTFTGEN